MGLFGGLFGGSGDSKTTTSASTTTNTTQNNDNKISADGGASVIGSGGGALTIDNHTVGIAASDAFGFTNGLVKAVMDQATQETGAISDLAKAGLGTLADALGKDNQNIAGQSAGALGTVAGLAQGSKVAQVGSSQYLPLALGAFVVIAVLYVALKHKG